MTEGELISLLDGIQPRVSRGRVSLWRDKDVTQEISPDALYVGPHLETPEHVPWVEKGGAAVFYVERYDDVEERVIRGWYAP